VEPEQKQASLPEAIQRAMQQVPPAPTIPPQVLSTPAPAAAGLGLGAVPWRTPAAPWRTKQASPVAPPRATATAPEDSTTNAHFAPAQAAADVEAAVITKDGMQASTDAAVSAAVGAPSPVDPEGDTEESDYDPFAADSGAAATAEPKEEERDDSDYDPFAADGAGAEAKGADKAKEDEFQPEELDDGEEDDSGAAFNVLLELLRAAEQQPKEVPTSTTTDPPAKAPSFSKATLPTQPQFSKAVSSPPKVQPPQQAPQRSSFSKAATPTAARPVDAGEDARPGPAQPATQYEYNPATQRWEPKKVEKPTPRPQAAAAAQPAATAATGAAGEGYKQRLCRNFPLGLCNFGARCRFAHSEQELRAAGAPGARPAAVAEEAGTRKNYVIAECEAEARADIARGYCEPMQALAVRLALRFESRPAGILNAMAEVGLPAAKDQRSTVKAIMRLCHPDKCKHPEAKRAMQILSPLLTT